MSPIASTIGGKASHWERLRPRRQSHF